MNGRGDEVLVADIRVTVLSTRVTRTSSFVFEANCPRRI